MKTRAFLFLSALLILSSCEDNASEPIVGVGTISGAVRLMDLPEGTEISDRSGVTVTVDGTELSTVSDAEGSWRIDGLPAGIYNILFTKEGLDTTRILRYRALGTGHYIFDTTTVVTLPGATSELRLARVELSGTANVAITAAGTCTGNDIVNSGVLRVTDLNGNLLAERQVQADSITGREWGNFRMYCVAKPTRALQRGERVKVVVVPHWSASVPVSATESVTKDFYGKAVPMDATVQ